MFEVFSVLYILIAAFALVMTMNEQARQSSRPPLMTALSVGGCLVWPLVMVGMIVAIRLQRAPAVGVSLADSAA